MRRRGQSPTFVLRLSLLLACLLLSLLAPSGFSDDLPVAEAPIMRGLPPGLHIPPFHVWRRVYRLRGASYYKKYRVSDRGLLTCISDPQGQRAAIDQMNAEIGAPMERGIGSWLSAGSRSPDESWEIGSSSVEDYLGGGLKLILLNRKELGSIEVTVPSEGRYRFSARPLAWGPDGTSMYISVAQGPTGARDESFLVFRIPERTFLRIGDIGAPPEFSRNGRWVIWMGHLRDNEAGWMSIGGKKVQGSHLLVFESETQISYQLTEGVEDVVWGGWVDRSASAPGKH